MTKYILHCSKEFPTTHSVTKTMNAASLIDLRERICKSKSYLPNYAAVHVWSENGKLLGYLAIGGFRNTQTVPENSIASFGYKNDTLFYVIWTKAIKGRTVSWFVDPYTGGLDRQLSPSAVNKMAWMTENFGKIPGKRR